MALFFGVIARIAGAVLIAGTGIGLAGLGLDKGKGALLQLGIGAGVLYLLFKKMKVF